MIATPLGEHAKLIRGITFKPADKCARGTEGSVVCMRTKNVQTQLDQSDLIAIPASIVKSPAKMIQSGHILVSSANSWNLVRKCCRVDQLQYPSTAGGFISILRSTSDQLDPSYLYRWFSWGATQQRLRSFGNQTTNISNLDHQRTLKLRIPLPPLPEQKRIAAILDAADNLRAKRRESLAQLDTLLQSTFLEMFGDPVMNPMGWDERAKLGEIAEIVSGITKGRKTNGSGVRDVPCLAVANVQDRHLKLETVKHIAATQAEITKYTLRPGDLLLTEGGDPDKLGRGSLWAGEIPECIHQNHVFRVRLTDSTLHPVFLNWIVGSERGKRYFEQCSVLLCASASLREPLLARAQHHAT